MPALENAKHELFAQELAKGATAGEASFASGLRLADFASADGAYVYLLVDPRDGKVFYVGKGRGWRALAHAKEVRAGTSRNEFKTGRIEAIHRAGRSVEILLAGNALTGGQAYRLERLLIVRCHKVLTNIALGERSLEERELEATRNGLKSIKPFCMLWRENPTPERVALWSRTLTALHRIEGKQAVHFERAA